MAKKKGLYATEIPAKGKKTAYTNPVGRTEVGDFPSPTVPRKAGQLHGLGPVSEPFGHPNVRGAHGFGHVAHMKHGHLRLSGYADAHRLGARLVGKVRKAPQTGK